MPLSDHEQRILEEIEKRLQEEDPRLAQAVSTASVHGATLRRVRWGIVGFVAGFIMLMLFMISLWIAIAGFLVMLGAAMLVYHSLRRLGREQIRAVGQAGGFSLTASLARAVERLRSRPPRGSPPPPD